MINNGLPSRQGLYNPQYEHDACGIGFVVDIKGRKSHQIIQHALTTLINLSHRGGSGSELNTGDGAGILIQIPHDFMKKACSTAGIELPEPGEYSVGMIYFTPDPTERKICEERFENIVKEAGQKLLGWRTVPVDPSSLGNTAKMCMPYMRQVFIKRSPDIKSDEDFERKLYLIRKKAEKAIRHSSESNNNYFYVASLSCRTIVYKGMLTAQQVELFYRDLSDEKVESALALVHSRYSTNTFPSWERAHPNRYLIHNGEINTIRGNVNWMKARQSVLKSSLFGQEIEKIFPIINEDGSDSAMFDNCLEFLMHTGHSLSHAAMMMVPEPWSNHSSMSDEKKAFYEYQSCLMEPWDGPAAMAFTDGISVGAVLDRNGLRPSRYYITKDGMVILASEVGVLDIPAEKVICKERLHPVKMLLIDTKERRIITDVELKHKMAASKPFREWLNRNMLELENIEEARHTPEPGHKTVLQRQKAFGYTYEDLRQTILPMAKDGAEPLGAMGNDIPLAVLSERPQLLYNYFKQLFAQVTNPPIDAIREELVTGTEMYIGTEGNMLDYSPRNCRRIRLKSAIIDNDQLEKLRHINKPDFKPVTLPILFKASEGSRGLEKAMDELFKSADQELKSGTNIIILSDRGVNSDYAAIPALLAVSGLHHHLIRSGTRTRASIILESGEPREVHHFCTLIGYGASAINPYLAFESIGDMLRTGMLTGISHKEAVSKYIKAAVKGIVKVLSKMGISTLQSYHGAQIFEAIGISKSVIDRYFTWTPSRIDGVDLDIITQEATIRHSKAFSEQHMDGDALESGGANQWRSGGEYHMFNPHTIHKLQQSCRINDYSMFKEYSKLINNETQKLSTIRGLLKFKKTSRPIPIEDVEPVESICKRFKTGAMSYGSISKEAHEALAIAMNRIGGRSNTGEGGEDPARNIPLPNGDSLCSAIKQVASGRFGVTSQYLSTAKEIQIKMAQGAKPGEGGQLPGRKVYPWIAATRHSTPGVGLISPPPHHDIYSIEDLAELIHDLKNANPDARINVKLVSEVGVGTVAAGVAKGRADVVLISGYDGGTGASPRTSIKHAGLPWELGLAETHQTLLLNNLRSRITVETDGKLMTGRDVVIAALLGAEEYGFATCPLVVLGCVMMRVCNLDTCPVGVATQNPALRKKFAGKPEYVVNFMHFIAQEMREIMADLGFKTINEMIGRTDMLETNREAGHWKTRKLNLSSILYQPETSTGVGRFCQIQQNHELEKSLDRQKLMDICSPALLNGKKVNSVLPISNTNRVVGTIVGSEITKRYGSKGLPEDTIELFFKGSAGQSFGAFIPKGMTLSLEGDANDYIGKGLSGGKIIVHPPAGSSFAPEKNIIIGNVAFYGATSGQAYIRGAAGERFCVRNSGMQAVVEAVGDHGCEYMTGGCVVVLGPTGRNFAAGMSGGIAYVLDESGDFNTKCNKNMVDLEKLQYTKEISEVRTMIEKHVKYTGSSHAVRILEKWDETLPKFVKIIPKDYKRMLSAVKHFENEGLTGSDALIAAFEANNCV